MGDILQSVSILFLGVTVIIQARWLSRLTKRVDRMDRTR
jgi:hypothetical protein